MFAVRGIAVAFSVFVLVYGAMSLAMVYTWRSLRLYFRGRPARLEADLLFSLRMVPLVSAAIITAVFTVPSFLLLEPRALNEPMSAVPLALAMAGVLLGVSGVLNAILGLRRASRALTVWTADATTIDAKKLQAAQLVPVLRISSSFPPMTAAGIVRPRVLLSSAAESVLTHDELQTALNHELAHVDRRDNLRKLLLRFVAFPGMGGLEAAWLEATEMAADDAAVSSAREALDLAAALIKVSRLGPTEAPAELTAALVRSPAAIMNARIERLVAWSGDRPVESPGNSLRYGIAASLAMLAAFAATYSHLLVGMHIATEWLVR
jgi:beta-lactamase regulating signal transducer with metallopeptidase domain